MTIKKHIPNALTCTNLFFGCVGVLFVLQNRLELAFFCTLLAAVCDFFDGFAARLLKVSSPIGKDLDSLADGVTFGVLPGFVMYKLLFNAWIQYSTYDNYLAFYYAMFAFIIPVFSIVRLAKFNHDTRQSDSFIGVPTPANALFIGSLGIMSVYHTDMVPWITNPFILMILSLVLSLLLIAELPLFALKFKQFGVKGNELRYGFILVSVILLVLLKLSAFVVIIPLYVLVSFIHNLGQKKA